MSYSKEVGSPQVGEKCLRGFKDHQLEEDILAPYSDKDRSRVGIRAEWELHWHPE